MEEDLNLQDLSNNNADQDENSLINELDLTPANPNQSGVIQPEVQGSYAAPFQSQIGNSTVDLTQGNNEETMMEEYREWFHLGRDRKWGILPYNKPEFQEQRNQLKDKWYQKYHGMGYDEFLENKQANAKTIYGNDATLKGSIEQMDQNFQALMVPGLAYADFTNDALGTVVPGYGQIDDRWDEKTKLDEPLYQNMRRILSIVLPAIHTGGKTNQLLAAR